MTHISEERLYSVEPITAIIGRTEGGDWLIEDRNGVRRSLKQSLFDDWVAENAPLEARTDIEPVVETVEGHTLIASVDFEEPAKTPKRSRKK